MSTIVEVETLEMEALQPFRTLRDKAVSKEGYFVADSIRVAKVILSCGIKPIALLTTPELYEEHKSSLERYRIPTIYLAQKRILEQIVGHRLHQHFMLLAKRPKETPLEDLGDHIVMVDSISSTQNVGAIARSAAALGATGYLLTHEAPHPYTRRSVRVSTGHIGMLRYRITDNATKTLLKLKSLGYKIIAAEVDESAIALQHFTPPKRWVLVVGHEEYGVSDEIMALADTKLLIPMQEGIKSLNVAVAASILLFWLTK